MLKKIAKRVIASALSMYTSRWEDYSRVFLLSDSPLWSIARDMEELSATCALLGIDYSRSRILSDHCSNQCLFAGSHFDVLLNNNKILQSGNKIGMAYFHGKPGTGVREFDLCFENLKKFHHKIERIQVSYSEMREVVLESGISPEKVFQIPIAINLDIFSKQTSVSRKLIREKLGIPQSAAVVGSFQKDGVGWEDGLKPKLIKGPDVFLQTVKLLKSRVPELYVLLSGPARGYVKEGLEKLGIPYSHIYCKQYTDVSDMFHALDLYIVSSREEGGPKAVLESMASGVPLVTTRVGQAMDIVKHEQNGWIVDPEDFEGLAHWSEYVLGNISCHNIVLQSALETAEKNSCKSQLPLWETFMNGFVKNISDQ